ncbi:hypothetical protein [Gillisia limnaea]|uniref:Uncharacterized protein n=1 Tax=Gillisia limnaea (strain DSM 15749 / LMG 21470 / R-8282) TaxID=865937 RepID=H2BUR3_GILLR|nr:hypothetical protein [Gillisia limnaea]EHQ01718.1 hypothetical protein Gilli_1042 [Gillisia limnaea DSM 15749]
MNIQAEKIELAKLLLNTNNPRIIQSIRKIFKKEKSSDFLDDLNSDEIAEIKKASLEIKEGKITDYETFMAKHR